MQSQSPLDGPIITETNNRTEIIPAEQQSKKAPRSRSGSMKITDVIFVLVLLGTMLLYSIVSLLQSGIGGSFMP